MLIVIIRLDNMKIDFRRDGLIWMEKDWWRKAQANKDADNICYLRERIRRIRIEIVNLNFYNKST